MADARLDHNVAAVAQWSEDEWAKWFFQVFREGNARPLWFSAREAAVSEIEELFEYLSESVRHRFRRGLIDALRMWDEGFHGLQVLRELAWTAGKVRAIHATGILIKILLDNRESMRFGDPFFGAADIILGTLNGFAVDEPDKRIETAFDGLFYDDDVAPHFSATLALGIATCNPSRFVEAFDRFVARAATVGPSFTATEIVLQFAENLTSKRIKDNLDALSREAKEYIGPAAVEARIIIPGELTGVIKDTIDKPLVAPIPSKPPADQEYESGVDRVRMTTRIRKGKKTSVYASLLENMKHHHGGARRTRARGRA